MTATRRTFPFGTPASVIAEQTAKDREEHERRVLLAEMVRVDEACAHKWLPIGVARQQCELCGLQVDRSEEG